MVYLNDWEDCKKQGLIDDFAITKEVLKGCKILLADYLYQDYSGDAYVIFVKEGKLYEVYGSHCSCYGLEGQWKPEETSIEFLENKIKNNSGYSDQLTEIIKNFKEGKYNV